VALRDVAVDGLARDRQRAGSLLLILQPRRRRSVRPRDIGKVEHVVGAVGRKVCHPGAFARRLVQHERAVAVEGDALIEGVAEVGNAAVIDHDGDIAEDRIAADEERAAVGGSACRW
jgi:hypothetical protein